MGAILLQHGMKALHACDPKYCPRLLKMHPLSDRSLFMKRSILSTILDFRAAILLPYAVDYRANFFLFLERFCSLWRS
jgi:hypothetical protein